MEYNSYEEYMNNLLGRNKVMEEKEVPVQNNIVINTEIQNIEENDNNIVSTDIDTYDINNNEFDDFYPDIYKIVYPVVCKRCLNVNEEVTEDLIDNITNDIYDIVEKDEREENNINNMRNNRNFRHIPGMQNTIQEKREVRQRNFLLNDLIRILVLRELIGSGRRPNRPNHHRPPMPPRPGEFPPPPPPRPEGRPPRF